MVIYIKFHLCVTRLKISRFADSENHFLHQGNKKTKLAIMIQQHFQNSGI